MMSGTPSLDLAQASHVMELQNGSSSLVTLPPTRLANNNSHQEQVSPPLSSPDSLPSEMPYVLVPSPTTTVTNTEESTTDTTPSSTVNTTSSSPPQETSLSNSLRNQLEYYFSKDNLATDKYLLSQMDKDHFVPLSVLANFNQVKKLCADMTLIIEAIKDSGTLKLDPTETKVKAIPEKRCILILREIPKDTPKEDVFQLFSSSNCPKFLSCDFAENDCWYVTFSGEEEAQEAFRYLREEVRDFLGKPIRARIKNTTVQRAASLPKTRPQYSYSSIQPVSFYQQPVVWQPPYFSEPPYAPPYINGFPSQPGFNIGGGSSTQNTATAGTRFVLPGTSAVTTTTTSSNNVGPLNTAVGLVNSPTTSTGTTTNNISGSTRRGGGNSSGVKGRHTINNDYSDRRSGGSREGRYRRNDDDRDRTRNLPNRFRNKRNEDGTTGTGDDHKNDKHSDKEKSFNEHGNSGRTRYQNRTQQPKLDFAPTSFPPLPGQINNPPLPPSSPESNLADIVKGRSGGVPIVSTDVKESNSSSNEYKLIKPSSPTTTTTVTTTTNTTSSGGASSIQKTTNVKSSSHRSSDKDSNSTVKQNASRNYQAVRGNNSGGRNRYRTGGGDTRTSKNNNNNSSSSRLPHKPKVNNTTANNTPTTTNTTNTVTVTSTSNTDSTLTVTTTDVEETIEEKEEESSQTSSISKSERMSYAQMAGQIKKSKSSPQGSTSDVLVLSPTNNTNATSSPVIDSPANNEPESITITTTATAACTSESTTANTNTSTLTLDPSSPPSQSQSNS